MDLLFAFTGKVQNFNKVQKYCCNTVNLCNRECRALMNQKPEPAIHKVCVLGFGGCSWWQGSAEFDKWPWSGPRCLWSVQCCPNLQRVGNNIFTGYGFAFFGMVVNVKHILKEQIGKELHGCMEVGIRDGGQDNEQVFKHSDLEHGRKCANIRCCSSGFSDNCRINCEIRVKFPGLMWPLSTCGFLSVCNSHSSCRRCTSLQVWFLFVWRLMMLSHFSCVCWTFVCLPWEKISIEGPLPIFNMVVYLFI